jgi:hypothetical protein
MAGRAGRPPRLGVHALAEVLETSLGERDVSLGERPRPLLERVQQDEQVPRPLIQDSVEVTAVVTPKARGADLRLVSCAETAGVGR